MKISRYEVLLKVIELGNISKAAEQLNYTQSGVSHIIQSFEKEIGFSVFIRKKHGIELTKDGERLKTPLRQIANYEKQLRQISDSVAGMEEGIIRIGTFQSVSMQWLPGIIKEFSSKFPKIEYELIYGDYEEIEQFLQEHRIDCGFIVEKVKTDMVFIPLIKDEFMVVLPPTHPYSELKSIPAKKLDKIDFIYTAEGEKFDLGAIIKETAIHPNIKVRSKDDYAAVAMVEQGLGICVLPSLLLDALESNVNYRPFKEHYYRTLGICLPNLQYASPLVKYFVDFVVDWISLRYQTDEQ